MCVGVCLKGLVTWPHSSVSCLRRVSVLTWATPLWRVWVVNSARHSTSPQRRSEPAASRGTTLPKNLPDSEQRINCWFSEAPTPGLLRSPWPDCPAPPQPIQTFSAFSLNCQSKTTLLNGVNWLDDSRIVSPSFSFLLFSILCLFFPHIPEYCGLAHPLISFLCNSSHSQTPFDPSCSHVLSFLFIAPVSKPQPS